MNKKNTKFIQITNISLLFRSFVNVYVCNVYIVVHTYTHTDIYR